MIEYTKEAFRKAWQEGYTFSQLGNLFGITRAAAAGRARLMGLKRKKIVKVKEPQLPKRRAQRVNVQSIVNSKVVQQGHNKPYTFAHGGHKPNTMSKAELREMLRKAVENT